MLSKYKICVLGQGYVGLPLAVALSRHFKIVAFDVNKKKINSLKKGLDKESILEKKFLNKNIQFSSFASDMKNCNVFIIAVPTPVDSKKNPDLRNLISATKIVAKFLKENNLVIYESTVYPGATEEVCVPILEKESKLKVSSNKSGLNTKTFDCAYCPERVNPGDKTKTVEKIVKVISATSNKSLALVYDIYKKISKSGICKAKSIKIAESAKIIENVQRDINIALINEFYILFKKMNLNIRDILEVASTKWNFLSFKPGLVGGHCIGVDPYYLTYKAKEFNYQPKLILAGRKINDDMSSLVFKDLLKIKKKKIGNLKKVKILILGYSFKENVSDYRNTKISEIVDKLSKKKFYIDIYDPHIYLENLFTNKKKLFIKKIKEKKNQYHIIIYAVNHKVFSKINYDYLNSKLKLNGFIYDLTDKFPRNLVAGSL
jgi:UDP-N-acetyl-D-galactosamine dehydrogenase